MSQAILLDESVFDETFFPERLIGREGQVEQIARCLKPALVRKSIKNLYIFGPPGVGKTLVAKWILRENFEKVSVYVNCWSKRTRHKIIEEVLLQMGYAVHGKESTSDLIKKFDRSPKKIIICLDESDYMKDCDILYDFTRSSNCLGLVLISNQAFALSDIDHRIKSGLFLDEVEFRPYSGDEILAILKERALYGLRTGSISENLISIVAKMANGDARVGLQTLKIAAKDAESKDYNSITIDEIKAAIKCARKYRLSYLLGKLNEHQRTIYEILKKTRSMDSGELLKEYKKYSKEELIERSYRNYMARMVELGLVREHGTGRWRKYEIII
jgi:Cdc6-like AAA superfamily ATPase